MPLPAWVVGRCRSFASAVAVASFLSHAAHQFAEQRVLGAVGYRFHATDHPDTMAAVHQLSGTLGDGRGSGAVVMLCASIDPPSGRIVATKV